MIINNRPIIIGIVAGEISGDILGAGLIRSLRKRIKQVYFFGIGGVHMKSEFMHCWYDIEELSVMGIVEVISKIPNLLNIRKNLIKNFLRINIDVFIGIDFPDFNISIEKYLKKKGIRIIHYVSPAIWAWRFNRIFDLKEATDNILLLFPFEKLIYNHFNIPHQLVGHALADEIPLNPNKKFMRQKLGIAVNKKCLTILPGSRIKEIKMLSFNFLTCVKLLSNKVFNLEVIVVLPNQKLVSKFIKLTSSISVKFRILCTEKPWEVMIASDLSLLTAGTAALECMFAKCPMVVAYRMNHLTFMLIRNFVKISFISLPNLLAGTKLVPEFIQTECTPQKIVETLLELLNYDDSELSILQRQFLYLHQSVRLKANLQAASAVLKLIKFR